MRTGSPQQNFKVEGRMYLRGNLARDFFPWRDFFWSSTHVAILAQAVMHFPYAFLIVCCIRGSEAVLAVLLRGVRRLVRSAKDQQ